MSANQPILVTGAHRSGSTWTGKMLALAPRVAYIHEPFNMDYAHPGKCTAHFPYRFTYITTENEAAYRQPLRRTIGLHYNVWPEVRQRGQLWPPLRDTLVARMQDRYGWTITPEQITFLPNLVYG